MAAAIEIEYHGRSRTSLHRSGRRLEITGNRVFHYPDDSRADADRRRSRFEFGRGRYNEAFPEGAIAEAIQALYESNGFRDAKVTTRVDDDYKGRTGDLAVYFNDRRGRSVPYGVDA